MKYAYKCPQCQVDHEFDLSVEEYEKFDAICERCKVKMDRTYDLPNVAGTNGLKEKPDGETPPSSCGSSCATCSGCSA